MANYIDMFRSNYFAVKDVQKFSEFIEKVPNVIVQVQDKESKLVMVIDNPLSDCGGGYPTYMESTDEHGHTFDEEINFALLVSKHLEHGEVAVFQEIGHEKYRYFVGFSIAVTWSGKTYSVDLEDIYKKVQRSTKRTVSRYHLLGGLWMHHIEHCN